jgi:hypothetical protein
LIVLIFDNGPAMLNLNDCFAIWTIKNDNRNGTA